MKPVLLTLLALPLLLLATGCEKPCSSVPSTKTVDRLGVLLDGGNLCKDESGVASIDYPKKSVDEIKKAYEDKLGGAGWKAEIPKESDKLPIIIFSKGEEKVMVTIGKSGDRHVTFALIKHCGDPGTEISKMCVKDITALGEALKK